MFSPELKRGSIELLTLNLLAEEPRHGYQVGKLIEMRSGGRLQFRIPSLYPVLCRMENRGWIKGRWVEKTGARRRCYYSLTAKGRKILQQQRDQWEDYMSAVNQVLGAEHA